MARRGPDDYDNDDLAHLQKLINRLHELAEKPRNLVIDESYLEDKMADIKEELREDYNFDTVHFLMVEVENKSADSLVATFDEIEQSINYEGED